MKKLIFLVPLVFLMSCASTQPDTTPNPAPLPKLDPALTQFALQAAGVGTSIAIIKGVDGDKAGTAKDILTVCKAVLTLLDGKIPSDSEVAAVMESFKSDGKTTRYSKVAQIFLLQFSGQLASWKASGADAQLITTSATQYIYGLQLGATIYAVDDK